MNLNHLLTPFLTWHGTLFAFAEKHKLSLEDLPRSSNSLLGEKPAQDAAGVFAEHGFLVECFSHLLDEHGSNHALECLPDRFGRLARICHLLQIDRQRHRCGWVHA